MTAWPSVTAVVPTRDRPQLLGVAVESILAQDYPGDLDVIVVLDQSPDPLALPDVVRSDRVRVIDNSRTPGLAGARNTGVLSTRSELVAFCDDDDAWLPGKLRRQVERFVQEPEIEFSTAAIEVEYNGHRNPRLAGKDTVTHDDLLRKRMAMLHSSSFVVRRWPLLDGIGLVTEDLPRSQNEDWDLLLRASRRHPIAHVDEPLVRVTWWARSFFASDWDTKVESLRWMLDHHPDLSEDPVGSARVYGQIAFAHAANGRRRLGVRWSRDTLRRDWRQPRGYIALAVAAGVSGDWVLRTLHRRGHGI